MSDDVSSLGLPTRILRCARCRNHGVLVPVRGHSKHCGWKLCSCDKCALLTDKHRAMASYRRSRKSPINQDNTPEEAAPADPSRPGAAASPTTRGSECVSSLVSYEREREPSRMYLGIPPLYHYSAFPMGFSPPAFGSAAPSPPGMPMTSIRPYLPTAWRMEQDGGGEDFRGQGYYPSFAPLMPGIYYMPPHMPLSPSMMAEFSRTMHASRSEDDQLHVIERSETSNKEPRF
ncbi:doublesex- and mab-3-related transcription factor B1 [Rana temporaria]|uniref:doublesex- and mab-3-related transcription factor B1 n=1 Tax=Rana temporaria TaxID=8407 RepID=UPI001AACC8B8|nr:doublesex- and mab-3-related transcription factor B1 [Rana temporaria]